MILARSSNYEEKQQAYQLFDLRMDGATHVWGGLTLQKDSEFLDLFNYHLLKAIENGVIKRLFRSYHIDLYIKEQFSMVEPQPLTYKNVMFAFIFLGTSIFVAILIALLEYIGKITKRSVRMATIREERIERVREGWGETGKRVGKEMENGPAAKLPTPPPDGILSIKELNI